MLQSMTGFGKATRQFQNKKITIELKSLNSKNLDIYARIPSEYKQYEIELRKIIGASLDRGKIECIINIESNGESNAVLINKDLIRSYHKQLKEIATELNLSEEKMLPVLMKMPEVFSLPQQEVTTNEWSTIKDILSDALISINAFRLKEGQFLFEEFTQRIDAIQQAFNKIPVFEKERIDSIKTRIENNLIEFVGGDKVDKNRFEQELIYYIEKIDITEEKHRLQNNLDFFIETLNEKKSQGKKLGFIVQEIGREINTLGSKSYHSKMQKLVVEMKDELEKIKEQILNTL
ncbi:MAG TPA: YicC family protein [Crocinitomix sp.]|nr:YicC family protein [Crocinitomix sp.]